MNDPYASEADTLALLRPDQRSDAEKKLDAMLEERGAWEQGSDAYPILYQFALEQMVERESIMQAITDPENQPSQFGTVTLAYMQREVAAVREQVVDSLRKHANLASDEFERKYALEMAAAVSTRGQS